MRILKWVLPIVPFRQAISMRANSKLLHVGVDPKGDLCVWTESDESNPLSMRVMVVVATGGDVPFGGTYVGSATQGAYVWHVYDFGEAA